MILPFCSVHPPTTTIHTTTTTTPTITDITMGTWDPPLPLIPAIITTTIVAATILISIIITTTKRTNHITVTLSPRVTTTTRT